MCNSYSSSCDNNRVDETGRRQLDVIGNSCSCQLCDEPQPFIEPITPLFENDFTFGNSFWFTIGSLMQQESELNPKV